MKGLENLDLSGRPDVRFYVELLEMTAKQTPVNRICKSSSLRSGLLTRVRSALKQGEGDIHELRLSHSAAVAC